MSNEDRLKLFPFVDTRLTDISRSSHMWSQGIPVDGCWLGFNKLSRAIKLIRSYTETRFCGDVISPALLYTGDTFLPPEEIWRFKEVLPEHLCPVTEFDKMNENELYFNRNDLTDPLRWNKTPNPVTDRIAETCHVPLGCIKLYNALVAVEKKNLSQISDEFYDELTKVDNPLW